MNSNSKNSNIENFQFGKMLSLKLIDTFSFGFFFWISVYCLRYCGLARGNEHTFGRYI